MMCWKALTVSTAVEKQFLHVELRKRLAMRKQSHPVDILAGSSSQIRQTVSVAEHRHYKKIGEQKFDTRKRGVHWHGNEGPTSAAPSPPPFRPICQSSHLRLSSHGHLVGCHIFWHPASPSCHASARRLNHTTFDAQPLPLVMFPRTAPRPPPTLCLDLSSHPSCSVVF